MLASARAVGRSSKGKSSLTSARAGGEPEAGGERNSTYRAVQDRFEYGGGFFFYLCAVRPVIVRRRRASAAAVVESNGRPRMGTACSGGAQWHLEKAPMCDRLAHTTAMVESWPGAKSLSVFFDINEAGPQEKRMRPSKPLVISSEGGG